MARNVEDCFDQIYNVCKGNKTAIIIQDTLDELKTDHHKTDGVKEQKFIAWAKQHKKLKVVSANIPYGILPLGIHGLLHDVKVNPKHGPDDAIYDASPEIRKKVARGNCILEIEGGAEPGLKCVTFAMKKFTGGLGDDDDKDRGDNHTWKRYFIKPLEDAASVVCTQKANGEAAHLSAIKISGEVYICAGSKNVHMLFRNRDDIEKYTEDRYRIASEVSKAIMDQLDSMEEKTKSRLLEFLSTSELTGVLEILSPDHQHVEDLSHLQKPELRFIAWTSCDLEPPDEQQLCYMAPHVAIDIARALGIPTVNYSVISPEKVDDRMKEIRRGYCSEGEVLYFIDKNGTVIGLLKKKTIWYIICRAIREKVKTASSQNQKNPHTFSISKAEKSIISISQKEMQITKRLKDIQSWLGLDDQSLIAWTDLGIQFLKWCLHKTDNGTLTLHQVIDLFPVIWKTFLEETGNTDKIDVTWEEPQGSDD